MIPLHVRKLSNIHWNIGEFILHIILALLKKISNIISLLHILCLFLQCIFCYSNAHFIVIFCYLLKQQKKKSSIFKLLYLFYFMIGSNLQSG